MLEDRFIDQASVDFVKGPPTLARYYDGYIPEDIEKKINQLPFSLAAETDEIIEKYLTELVLTEDMRRIRNYLFLKLAAALELPLQMCLRNPNGKKKERRDYVSVLCKEVSFLARGHFVSSRPPSKYEFEFGGDGHIFFLENHQFDLKYQRIVNLDPVRHYLDEYRNIILLSLSFYLYQDLSKEIVLYVFPLCLIKRLF